MLMDPMAARVLARFKAAVVDANKPSLPERVLRRYWLHAADEPPVAHLRAPRPGTPMSDDTRADA